MESNMQPENIEKAFFSDGYHIGMKAIEQELSGIALHEGLREMYSAIDDFIESFVELAVQNKKSPECKKGCEWCCHQPVFALDYELEYLNNFLNENFSEEERKKISSRAEQKMEKLKGLDKDALLNSKYPCPLLENGSCTAYEARPMACRIYLSYDVKTCLRFYNHPDDKKSYPALLEFSMRAGRMMNEGFKAALKTNGIIAKEYRIEEKLHPI